MNYILKVSYKVSYKYRNDRWINKYELHRKLHVGLINSFITSANFVNPRKSRFITTVNLFIPNYFPFPLQLA